MTTDYTELTAELRSGVKYINNEVGDDDIYDIDEANDKMNEAANAIQELSETINATSTSTKSAFSFYSMDLLALKSAWVAIHGNTATFPLVIQEYPVVQVNEGYKVTASKSVTLDEGVGYVEEVTLSEALNLRTAADITREFADQVRQIIADGDLSQGVRLDMIDQLAIETQSGGVA